jgi:hypothetical protein
LGNPPDTATEAGDPRNPNTGPGDQQPVGTETVDEQDPSTRASNLQATGTVDSTQNLTNEQEMEEQVTTRPTSTTTTTANSTINSTSITSAGPTTITATINLTGPTPITTTTITKMGVAKITTNTTPFMTIDTDTEEESTKDPTVSTRKWITQRIPDRPKKQSSLCRTLNICLYISLYIYMHILILGILCFFISFSFILLCSTTRTS